MSEHEDLIAEANENLDKAADAAPVSARQAILTGMVEDQRMSLIARLKHALEKVTAERDNWKLSAEEAERAEKRWKDRAHDYSTERDELAAVVEQVRATLEHYQGQKVDVAPIDILDMLPAPSVALDRVKAEALREAADYLDSFEGPGGRQSAHDRAGRDIIRLIRDRADRIEKGESNE